MRGGKEHVLFLHHHLFFVVWLSWSNTFSNCCCIKNIKSKKSPKIRPQSFPPPPPLPPRRRQTHTHRFGAFDLWIVVMFRKLCTSVSKASGSIRVPSPSRCEKRRGRRRRHVNLPLLFLLFVFPKKKKEKFLTRTRTTFRYTGKHQSETSSWARS